MRYLKGLVRSSNVRDAPPAVPGGANAAGHREVTAIRYPQRITDMLGFESVIAGPSASANEDARALYDALIGGTSPPCALHLSRPVIFRGFERASGLVVAIKVLHKSAILVSSQSLWPQLCDRILNLHYHPNLLTTFAIFEDEERYYMVNELLHGGEFFTLLQTADSAPEELCKHLIRQILLSLEVLHTNNLVHRDVKPENTVFRHARHSTREFPYTGGEVVTAETTERIVEYLNEFELVLIDLDTIRITDAALDDYADWGNKRRRRLIGTFNYMAPELLTGADHTPMSDLWSVGVILYILMTGRPPFSFGHMRCAQTTKTVLKEAEARGINFDVYPLPHFEGARDLCVQLLQFDPQRRYPNATSCLHHPWLNGTATLSSRYYFTSLAGPSCRQPVPQPPPLPPSSRLTLPRAFTRCRTPAHKLRDSTKGVDSSRTTIALTPT